MKDALLEDKAWKTLADKQKLKNDKGLAKALSKLGDGDAKERLAALTEVATVAGKLAKDDGVSKDEKLTKYLADMLKAAQKAKKELDAAGGDAAAGGAESEEEEEEESGDFGARLFSGIDRVKKGAGKVTSPFAACPGNPVLALVVAKRITTDHKNEIKAASGGTQILVGTCTFEEGKLTFVMDVVKAGLARALQKSIKHFTTKNWAVRVRDTAGNVDAAEMEEEPKAGRTAAAEVAVKGDGTGAASWAKARALVVGRLNEVAAKVKKSKHPKAAKAALQLRAVVMQLTGQPDTYSRALEVEKYFRDDEVVDDICSFASDIRTPLLAALAKLKADLAPSR